MLAGDALTQACQWRAVVEYDRALVFTDAEFSKQAIQIDVHRLVFHIAVKPGKHFCACGLVANLHDAIQAPCGDIAAALAIDRTQRILQAAASVGLLVDVYFGKQPERGAAPIGSPPGMRVIEPLVARGRLPLWH